jgi:hypothetical protein
MFDFGVTPEFLGISNDGHVIKKDVHMVTHARKHSKLDGKLPQPSSSFAASAAAIYSYSIVD